VLCYPGFEPRRGGKRFFSYTEVQIRYGAQTPSYWMRAGGCFSRRGEEIGRGVRLTTHFHLGPRTIMNGAVSPFFLHVFVACIETNLLLIGDYEERACFVKGFMVMFNLLHRIHIRVYCEVYLISITFREVARLVTTTYYCLSLHLYWGEWNQIMPPPLPVIPVPYWFRFVPYLNPTSYGKGLFYKNVSLFLKHRTREQYYRFPNRLLY